MMTDISTTPALHVRQATVADLDDLVPLFNDFRVFHGKEPDLEGARQFLRDRFDHRESVVFIAQVDGAPAGFAQLYPSFSSTAMARVFILNDLYVHERARRLGVASRLLDQVERFAATSGAVRVSLNVVRANTRAQALYAARGWQQDQEFFTYHRYDLPAG